MAVYFVRAGDTEAVKIGFTLDVRARLAFLQSGNHLPLTVIREIEGGEGEERWLHRHFAPRRIRGEWFSYCDEMLTVIPPTLPVPTKVGVPQQTSLPVLARIDAFLRQTGMTETRLGIEALGDGSFVKRLRDGRGVRLNTVDRLFQYIDKNAPSEAA